MATSLTLLLLFVLSLPCSSAPVASDGAAEDWVGTNAACMLQRATCSVRFGGVFSYTIATTPAHFYLLRLTFTEVWWEAAGQRVFNVLVDGVTVLPGVDPFALAGAKFAPVVREVLVAATGPNMVVALQAVADNALLAALEVGGATVWLVVLGACERQVQIS